MCGQAGGQCKYYFWEFGLKWWWKHSSLGLDEGRSDKRSDETLSASRYEVHVHRRVDYLCQPATVFGQELNSILSLCSVFCSRQNNLCSADSKPSAAARKILHSVEENRRTMASRTTSSVLSIKATHVSLVNSCISITVFQKIKDITIPYNIGQSTILKNLKNGLYFSLWIAGKKNPSPLPSKHIAQLSLQCLITWPCKSHLVTCKCKKSVSMTPLLYT